jgi:hypothetical protein
VSSGDEIQVEIKTVCFSFANFNLSTICQPRGFMSMSNGNIVSLGNIDALSFDAFGRNPERDIVCVAPIRTMVRREEEIVLVRRVRKVEEVDASPACPINSTQMNQVQQDGEIRFQSVGR